MLPYVYGAGEEGVTAFTEPGIECLRQIIADVLLSAAHRCGSIR
jgi:hypothetical protein